MKKFLLSILTLTALSAAAKQPERGYRVLTDISTTFNIPVPEYGTGPGVYTGVMVSQGYQFNHNLYVGGGIGVEFPVTGDGYILPIFAHVRGDFKRNNFTPYVDCRVGFNVYSGPGVYLSPTVGYRFSMTDRLGLNLGIGITWWGHKEPNLESDVLPSLRIGIDF